jgi:hypothetical protein
MWRPFEFKRLVRALFCGCLLCHAALVAGSGVLVNEAFASGPIDERNCGAVVIARRRASMSFLERGAEGGALGAVARHGGSGLTHVLLGGRNIRHWQISIGFGPSRLVPAASNDIRHKGLGQRASMVRRWFVGGSSARWSNCFWTQRPQGTQRPKLRLVTNARRHEGTKNYEKNSNGF